MKRICHVLLGAVLLIGNSFSCQEGLFSNLLNNPTVSPPNFLGLARRSCVINITPYVYQEKAFSRAEQLVAYSAWRYCHDTDYQKAIAQQIENTFSLLCQLNDPVVHLKVRARLALLFLQAEPLYASLLASMQDKLIRKYYHDDGRLRYPFHDDLLAKSAEVFCKQLFISEDLPQRFKSLGDRSALLLEELEKGDFFNNAYSKMMSIGWRCKEKAKHPRSACTIQRAQVNQYNQHLYQLVKSLESGQYHKASLLVDRNDRLMQEVYDSAIIEIVLNNLSLDIQQYNLLEILSANVSLEKSSLQAQSIILLAENFNTELAPNYDFETINYNLLDTRRAAAQRYQQEQESPLEHTVIITPHAQRALETNGYNYQKFTLIKGNALQRQLLDESAYLINHGADYYDKSKEPLTQLLIDMADCAIDCAHAGSLIKGYQCADVGWCVLGVLRNIALGIADGILDGVVATGEYIGAHPVECALSAIFCKTMLAYHVSRLALSTAITVGRILETIDYQNISSDDLVKGIEKLAVACADRYQELRQKSVRELVSCGVSCAVDIYLQGRCARGLQKFYRKTQQKVVNYVKTVDWQSFKKENLNPGFINGFSEKHNSSRVMDYAATATKRTIQKFTKEVIDKYRKHIFSANHIKNGIMRLGSSEDDILGKLINIILEADNQNVLSEGLNQILTTINKINVEVRVFIKDNSVLSIDGFVGNSERTIGKVIWLKHGSDLC